jgi:hypothetical protein
VVDVRLQRRWRDRLRRRGALEVTTTQATVLLGPLRHPEAFARLVQGARQALGEGRLRYDHVFNPDETWGDGGPSDLH